MQVMFNDQREPYALLIPMDEQAKAISSNPDKLIRWAIRELAGVDRPLILNVPGAENYRILSVKLEPPDNIEDEPEDNNRG